VTQEILDYVLREMTDPAGGFYATQDADSEGEEGKFFVWTPKEIRAALGEEEAGRFEQAYGVTEPGNASTGSAHGFEGKNILTFKGVLEEHEALAKARRKLFAVRERRVHPGRDEKVLASWNGLMLAAFAEAARVLDRADYGQAAERNGDFLLRQMRDENGRLWHVWNAGQVKVKGHLEDHANLVEGLIELYQATFDPRWYKAAQELTGQMIEHFSAPQGFFDTADDDEALIVRTHEVYDHATPSGNAMAATALLKLAGLAAEPRYAELARHSLAHVQEYFARAPLGFGQWLCALDYVLSRPKEIAIVGNLEATDTQTLLKNCHRWLPPAPGCRRGDGRHSTPGQPPQVDGKATAYVCAEGTCRLPVTDPEALA